MQGEVLLARATFTAGSGGTTVATAGIIGSVAPAVAVALPVAIAVATAYEVIYAVTHVVSKLVCHHHHHHGHHHHRHAAKPHPKKRPDPHALKAHVDKLLRDHGHTALRKVHALHGPHVLRAVLHHPVPTWGPQPPELFALRAHFAHVTAKPVSTRSPAVNLIAKRASHIPSAMIRGRVQINVAEKASSDLLNRFDAIRGFALTNCAFDLDSNSDEDPAPALLIVALARRMNTAAGAVQKKQNMALSSRQVAKEAAKLKPGQELHGWWVLEFGPKGPGQALPVLVDAWFIPDGPVRTPPVGPGPFIQQGDNMTPPTILTPVSNRLHIFERDVVRKD